jgi:hypothetical protein
MKTFSAMYIKPLDELAVNARAPEIEAPMHMAIALCSDSTAWTCPFVNRKPRRNSMISV